MSLRPSLCVLLILGAAAALPASAAPGGYIAPADTLDAVALLPSPPAATSAAMALDLEVSAQALDASSAARRAQATVDADMALPAGPSLFTCAVGVQITEAGTPALHRLLRLTRKDAKAAVAAAKEHHARPRPSATNGRPNCSGTPDLPESYPSGHATVGAVWAQVLGELFPERVVAIEQRGRSLGDSRLICNKHWHSDVVQARTVAAAVTAQLHAAPAFQRDLALAREEIARTGKDTGGRDCAAEETVLKERPASAL